MLLRAILFALALPVCLGGCFDDLQLYIPPDDAGAGAAVPDASAPDISRDTAAALPDTSSPADLAAAEDSAPIDTQALPLDASATMDAPPADATPPQPDLPADLPADVAPAVDAPGTCGPKCVLNDRRCGPNGGFQTCVLDSSCSTWGKEMACDAPTHGYASCTGMACVPHCDQNYLLCSSGTCEGKSHAFEAASIEGAHVDSSVTANYSRALRNPLETRAYAGGHGLAVDVKFDSTLKAIAILLPLCPGTATSQSLRGRKFSANLYIDGPATSDGQLFIASASIPVGFLIGSRPFVDRGATVPLTGTFPPDEESDTVNVVSFTIGMRGDPGTGWQGTIYIDDVVIE